MIRLPLGRLASSIDLASSHVLVALVALVAPVPSLATDDPYPVGQTIVALGVGCCPASTARHVHPTDKGRVHVRYE